MRKKILFTTGRQPYLAEYWNLIEAAKQSEDFIPIVYVDFPLTPAFRERLEKSAITFIEHTSKQRVSCDKGSKRTSRRKILSKILPQFAKDFLAAFRDFQQTFQKAQSLYKETGADAVVFPGIGNLVRQSFWAAAKRNKLKTILIPPIWKFSKNGILFQPVETSQDSWFKKIFFILSPRLFRHFDARYREGDFMVRVSYGQWSAAACLGVLPQHPLSGGSDLVDLNCVAGQHSLDLLRSLDISTQNTVVTGKPRFDSLRIDGREKRHRKIELGLDPNKPTILCNIPHWEDGYFSNEELAALVREMKIATDIPGVQTIFSYLPGYKDELYERLAADIGITRAKINDLTFLLPVVDVYINDYNSTTLFFAMSLGTPTVAFHFWGDYWELFGVYKECNGIVKVFKIEDFKPAILKLFSSPEYYQELVEAQKKNAAYFVDHQGNSSQRILEEIRRLWQSG